MDADPHQPLGILLGQNPQCVSLVSFGVNIVNGDLLTVDRLLEKLDELAKLVRREDRRLLLVVHPQDERGDELHLLGTVLTPPAEHLFRLLQGDLVVVDQIEPVGSIGVGQQLGGVSDVRLRGTWGRWEGRSPVALL